MCAKVSGPFMSLSASGTVGKLITACTWKGRPYMRQHFIPANPNTDAQKKTRAGIRLGSQAFAAFSEQDKDIWNEYASSVNNSGIAVFMKKAMQKLTSSEGMEDIPESIEVLFPDDPANPGISWEFPD